MAEGMIELPGGTSRKQGTTCATHGMTRAEIMSGRAGYPSFRRRHYHPCHHPVHSPPLSLQRQLHLSESLLRRRLFFASPSRHILHPLLSRAHLLLFAVFSLFPAAHASDDGQPAAPSLPPAFLPGDDRNFLLIALAAIAAAILGAALVFLTVAPVIVMGQQPARTVPKATAAECEEGRAEGHQISGKQRDTAPKAQQYAASKKLPTQGQVPRSVIQCSPGKQNSTIRSPGRQRVPSPSRPFGDGRGDACRQCALSKPCVHGQAAGTVPPSPVMNGGDGRKLHATRQGGSLQASPLKMRSQFSTTASFDRNTTHSEGSNDSRGDQRRCFSPVKSQGQATFTGIGSIQMQAARAVAAARQQAGEGETAEPGDGRTRVNA